MIANASNFKYQGYNPLFSNHFGSCFSLARKTSSPGGVNFGGHLLINDVNELTG